MKLDLALAGGLALAMGGCIPGTEPGATRVPTMAPYPVTLDAFSARGEMVTNNKGCVVLQRADGSNVTAVFRSEQEFDAIAANLGGLDRAKPVTVEAMTVLHKLPAAVAAYIAARDCPQQAFVFGRIVPQGPMSPAPPPPPAAR